MAQYESMIYMKDYYLNYDGIIKKGKMQFINLT